jgi:two-component sensor histidine kinase
MILSELITNAFKYAFPDRRSGQVDVGVTANDGRVTLEVADQGVGLPTDFNPEKTESFGWQLIRNLTAQIGGTYDLESSQGTRVRVTFLVATNPVVDSKV